MIGYVRLASRACTLWAVGRTYARTLWADHMACAEVRRRSRGAGEQGVGKEQRDELRLRQSGLFLFSSSHWPQPMLASPTYTACLSSNSRTLVNTVVVGAVLALSSATVAGDQR